MTNLRSGESPRGERISFGKLKDAVAIPNLIETQRRSYEEFLQTSSLPSQRELIGLHAAFRSTFPITTTSSSGDSATLDFVEYAVNKPKYSEDECIERGMTYSAPLKVKFQLIVREVDRDTQAKHIKDIKEQEVYIGEVPLMTDRGTFIINGAERVVVSQLHRSPGVTFSEERHSSGRPMYYARVIPTRGAWLEFEIDATDRLFVSIDRRRKFHATTLLRAFGCESDEEILAQFYKTEKVKVSTKEKPAKKVAVKELSEYLNDYTLQEDVFDPAGVRAEPIAQAGDRVTSRLIMILNSVGVKTVNLADIKGGHPILGRILAEDLVDMSTGEVIAESKRRIDSHLYNRILELNIPEVTVLVFEPRRDAETLLKTLNDDKYKSQDEALIEFYRKIRPGNPPSPKAGAALLENLFSNDKRYHLGKVGRYRLNMKLGVNRSLDDQLLSLTDLVDILKYLIAIKMDQGDIDDIDHLGNRRVRSVGELLENQVRIGLAAMERSIRERMSLLDIENVMPASLINHRPLINGIKDFFGRSQLSQFMDQTNPLSELTHKRRLSALGPGGLNRDRAGFEVRDVHYTHYGRICPIETPEGPNIGLINSLATFARINDYGFIETPYQKVVNGRVTKQIDYLSAEEEDKYIITQANEPVDEKGNFLNPTVLARIKGDFQRFDPQEVHYMDVSPKQLVSVSASLIPFLEHDDANRALMGSNMQRQAVPLVRTDAPYVGTGMEGKSARDSGMIVLAQEGGTVTHVSGNKIIIRESPQDYPDYLPAQERVYKLRKFIRSNQDTCMNQKPIVRPGDKVTAGQVIADGPATSQGELALGRNLLAAIMPWQGYNFEDAILLSERVVREDLLTSIHIEEYEVEARETRLGPEEITRDIPNVGEDALRNLDESGIVRVGAEVRPNDILVGKVTPKGETELSSEEKLLRAIFGEKASETLDTSLRVPPGTSGIVIAAHVFSRKDFALPSEKAQEAKILEEAKHRMENQVRRLRAETRHRIELLFEAKLKNPIYVDGSKKAFFKPGDPVDAKLVDALRTKLAEDALKISEKEVISGLKKNLEFEDQAIEEIRLEYDKEVEHIKTGDELPPGVRKMVKVYIAQKRKVNVGDKLAGRHGNKGVISRIMPEQDMPFLEDGTPVDIVLNPLGVPSRMNVGQILECHLGWAASKLGIRVATPVFAGASEEDIREALKQAGLPETGTITVLDGRTGEPFERKVTVGIMYMLKLAHMVDDKIHARAIGPYSLVTQQPLGGKAQFGGQRFGEMEVWALEAYGAAHILQELLTVKSDDVSGRTKSYESIVKGETTFSPGIPESFNVLIKELQSLGLNMEVLYKDHQEETIENDGTTEPQEGEQTSAEPEEVVEDGAPD
jgi:DNA-directed RNA polymerase subunit beta